MRSHSPATRCAPATHFMTGGASQAQHRHDHSHRTDTNGNGSGPDAYGHLHPLLVEFHACAAGDPERMRLRERLVGEFLPVAHNIANRYRQRGVPTEDLHQVAAVGLLQALDRFDPHRGSEFLAFAVPTIRGEVRRHFRDHTWAVRPPRALQELISSVDKAREELTTGLSRAPRPSEVADHLGVGVEEVLAALNAYQAHNAAPLDRPVKSDESGSATLGGLIGGLDRDLELVDDRQAVEALLDELDERERTIVLLRFFGNMSQAQIGERIGCSQMHVSRLLSRALARLREQLVDPSPTSSDPPGAGSAPGRQTGRNAR